MKLPIGFPIVLRTLMASGLWLSFNNNAKDYAPRNAARFGELLTAAHDGTPPTA